MLIDVFDIDRCACRIVVKLNIVGGSRVFVVVFNSICECDFVVIANIIFDVFGIILVFGCVGGCIKCGHMYLTLRDVDDHVI